MHIDRLSIVNFKNYSEASIALNQKLNCFVGNNGIGKTNLLDAVYYLCMSKSYFHSSDLYSIREGENFMVLQGNFIAEEKDYEIYCGLKKEKRKIFRKNKKEYKRISEHIGKFPVVMVSPADSSLILGGSEERRKYINAVISQYNPAYLENIIRYNKILTQRNKLLKNMQGTGNARELLEVYNSQIIPLGKEIHAERKLFIEKLNPLFKDFYYNISDGLEQVSIQYNSQLNNKGFDDLINQNMQSDLAAQHTTTGIHKDDLELTMFSHPIKKIGSQGQQKTFLTALKMAQFVFLSNTKKIPPILLLDDIFDKFDVNRVKQIIHLVSGEKFGQIFITHTSESRMMELLKGYVGKYSLFRVEQNGIKQVDHEKK